MLGWTKTSDTRQTSPRCLSTPHPTFCWKINWPERSRQCGPSGYSSPGPTLDKSLKAGRSLCPVISLHYYLDRTSAKQGADLSHLQERFWRRYLPCHNFFMDQADWSCATSSLIRKPSPNIRLKPIMWGPLLLLRPSSWEFPYDKFVSLSFEVT